MYAILCVCVCVCVTYQFKWTFNWYKLNIMTSEDVVKNIFVMRSGKTRRMSQNDILKNGLK